MGLNPYKPEVYLRAYKFKKVGEHRSERNEITSSQLIDTGEFIKINTIVSIRDCVYSGLCPFGIVSIWDYVYSGWCPNGIVSTRDCVKDPSLCDGNTPFLLVNNCSKKNFKNCVYAFISLHVRVHNTSFLHINSIFQFKFAKKKMSHPYLL